MTGPDRYTAFLRQLPHPNTPEQRQPRYPLSTKDTIALGRDPHCQVVVDPILYRAVSRRHAEISLIHSELPHKLSSWQVCDLNSANGTFVNGQRLYGCQILQSGDRLMLGQNGPEFIFEVHLTSVSHPGVSAKPAPVSTRSPHPGTPPPASTTRPKRLEAEPISLTQLFPIFSTGRELTRKAYLLPGGITVAFVVLMFISVGQPIAFNLLLAAYLAGAAGYFIYQLCGKHKPWWILAGTGLMTLLIVLSPVLDLFVFVFRQLLPGNLPTDSSLTSFPSLLIKMFFGAGLMEELIKAIPVLIAYGLGTQLRSPWRERLGVWEPLDGILFGSASAVGFTLVETLGQYLPEIYKATLVAGEEAAQLASLQLLIPRVLGSVAGHMAYSGYLGYFIGLSVLRPRQRWLILGIGYLTASGLHALWNATGAISPVLLALVGLLSYAFLAAAILKARELSPTRSQNFATRFYK